MAKTRVKLNSRGVRELLTSPEVRADLEARGERVAAAAKETAPVETGQYRDGITSWSATTDRSVVGIGSRARHAPLVEANTGNLVRALDAAGGS